MGPLWPHGMGPITIEKKILSNQKLHIHILATQNYYENLTNTEQQRSGNKAFNNLAVYHYFATGTVKINEILALQLSRAAESIHLSLI